MKAVVNDIAVEGTPKEIYEYAQLNKKKKIDEVLREICDNLPTEEYIKLHKDHVIPHNYFQSKED